MADQRQRPDAAKTLASVGVIMFLIPIILLLGLLFVAIAWAGGWYGALVAAALIWVVVELVRKSRRG